MKAIFPVHLTGHCVDMAVMTAAFPSLPMIEDACHVLGGAHGSGEGVRPVGAGDVSRAVMFSTHPVKTIATGEGGVLTTADSAFASRLRRLRNHGMTRDPATFVNTDMAYEDVGAGTGAGDSGTKPAPWYYEMQEVGWNYRLTDLQCALGIRQLEKLPHFVETRRRLRDHYAQWLDRLSVTSNGLVRAQPVAPGCQPAWHLAVALIDFEGLGTTRTDVMHNFGRRGWGHRSTTSGSSPAILPRPVRAALATGGRALLQPLPQPAAVSRDDGGGCGLGGRGLGGCPRVFEPLGLTVCFGGCDNQRHDIVR